MRITPAAARPQLMVQLLLDGPNILTLIGFCLSVTAMFLALGRQFELAIVAALWAVVADWIDGWVASQLPGRPTQYSEIGSQLDSFADLISGAIFPGVLLMVVGDRSLLALAVALFVATAGILRLSYFNVYGATEHGRIVGLPIAHNILVLALVVILRPIIPEPAFFPMLATVNVALAGLNIAPFFFPRGRPAVIPWIVAFAVLATLIFVLRLAR